MASGPGNFPTINGVDYGYSSINLNINGIAYPLTGIKDFSYKQSLKPGEARGTFAQITSRSTGQYSADGSLTVYKAHAAALLNSLNTLAAAQGICVMQFAFDITANYSEAAVGLVTDFARSCRITEISDTHAEEDGVLTQKFSLHIIQIDMAGIPPFIGTILP